jgi:acyl-CoA thioesterase FadM
MKKDDTGEMAARTVLVAVHLDAVTRKARALPDDVRAAARALIERAGPA